MDICELDLMLSSLTRSIIEFIEVMSLSMEWGLLSKNFDRVSRACLACVDVGGFAGCS